MTEGQGDSKTRDSVRDHGSSTSSAVNKSPSHDVLDLTGAVIASVETQLAESGSDPTTVVKREAVPSISLPRQSTHVRHFALDMGGSLVKIVYFSPDCENVPNVREPFTSPMLGGGRLHFRKFEASKMDNMFTVYRAETPFTWAQRAGKPLSKRLRRRLQEF